MRQLYCLLSLLWLTSAPAGVMASEIARWVDDNGTTHFGNPQFAPPQTFEMVEVAPANGMVAPQGAAVSSTSARPVVVTLDRPRMQNKKGFRGYDNRPSASQNRKR